MRKPTERWLGGRVYTTTDGTRRWILEREAAGARYNLTLSAASEEEAILEYRAFKSNPAAYAAQLRGEKTATAALTLNDTLVADFLRRLEETKRSRPYRAAVRNYLAAWGEALNGRDLKRLDAKTVKHTLQSFLSALKWRTIAFKSFCSYLVDRGDIDPNEDPGRFLTVPSARRKHATKAYSIDAVQRMYTALPTQLIRDVLCIQAKTGMHMSEVCRLAAREGVVREVQAHGSIAGTVTFTHKTGEPHVVSLDAQTLAAAQRLYTRGRGPDRHTIQNAVEIACKHNSGLTKINFGALRHSFGTWLSECGTIYAPKGIGLPPEKVAEALGHSSARTTKMHYIDVVVPPMYVVPIKLSHPEDPVVMPSIGANNVRDEHG